MADELRRNAISAIKAVEDDLIELSVQHSLTTLKPNYYDKKITAAASVTGLAQFVTNSEPGDNELAKDWAHFCRVALEFNRLPWGRFWKRRRLAREVDAFLAELDADASLSF